MFNSLKTLKPFSPHSRCFCNLFSPSSVYSPVIKRTTGSQYLTSTVSFSDSETSVCESEETQREQRYVRDSYLSPAGPRLRLLSSEDGFVCFDSAASRVEP